MATNPRTGALQGTESRMTMISLLSKSRRLPLMPTTGASAAVLNTHAATVRTASAATRRAMGTAAITQASQVTSALQPSCRATYQYTGFHHQTQAASVCSQATQ